MIPKLAPFNRACVAVTIAVSLILLAQTAEAAPVRVVTWNLQPREMSGPETPALSPTVAAEAAKVLKDLNPDIIVLQQVPDSASCDTLIQALGPGDYQLAVLSAFRDSQTGAVNHQQTAIVSRGKAANPAWDTWKTPGQTGSVPGGYASAIIRLDNQSIGVFAVQLGDIASVIDIEREGASQQAAREDAARQLVQQIDALHDSNGDVKALVVAGDFNTTVDDPKLSRELTLTRLERAGFASAFGDVPPDKRVTLPGYGTQADATVDYIFTRDAGKPANVRVVPVNTTVHMPVTSDLDFGVTTLAAAAPGPVSSGSNDASAPDKQGAFEHALIAQIGPQNVSWLAGLLLGGLICIVFGVWLLGQSGNSGGLPGSLETSPSGGGLSVLSPPNAGDILVMSRGATQTGSALRTGPAAEGTPVVHVQGSGLPQSGTGTEAEEWRRRAEAAERRADRSAGVLREGLLQQLSQWLKGGIARQLVSDRAQLLEAQRTAALKMQAVDQRLTKVEVQIQLRMREYEFRITDLEKELAAAREENRELIRAKIAQVRAEMERERTRLLQHAQIG